MEDTCTQGAFEVEKHLVVAELSCYVSTPASRNAMSISDTVLPSALEAIGNTPLIELGRLTKTVAGRILAKAEFLNPGHSTSRILPLKLSTYPFCCGFPGWMCTRSICRSIHHAAAAPRELPSPKIRPS
jgi:hypothetical protein